MRIKLSQKKISPAEFYDKTAPIYDARHKNPYTEHIRSLEKKLLRKFAHGRILDIGCGTGFHLEFLEKMNKEMENKSKDKQKNELYGIDVSDEMLKIASKKLKNSALMSASAEKLPFPDERFDTVLCVFMVLNMCDYEKVMQEIYRVLKHGGYAILSIASIWDNYGKLQKKVRIEKQNLYLRLFRKSEIEGLFAKNRLRVLYFNSAFRSLKPKWGDFSTSKGKELNLLLEEKNISADRGAVYFYVLEKIQ